MENNGKKIAGIICIVLGSIFLFVGLTVGGVMFITKTIFQAQLDAIEEEMEAIDDLERTEGEIVDVYSGGSSGYSVGGSAYTEIGFYDDDDEYYEIIVNAYSSELSEGDEIDVYYDAKDPATAYVPGIVEEVLELIGDIFSAIGLVIGIGFGGFGLILLIVGIVLVKKSKPQNNYY